MNIGPIKTTTNCEATLNEVERLFEAAPSSILRRDLSIEKHDMGL